MKPIFSDDPQAIDKLEKKLASLQATQDHMKKINAGYKKHGLEWVAQQVSPETFHFYVRETEYSWNKGRFYPAWALQNNNQNMTRIKKRIASLTKEVA